MVRMNPIISRYFSILDVNTPTTFKRKVTPVNIRIRIIIFPVVLLRDKRESFVTFETIIAPNMPKGINEK
jgi:hypothetical protein